jgi:hypothetical protein
LSQEPNSPPDLASDQFQWLSVPELAAFRSGRLANQIEHQTMVLWLLGDERKADPSLGLPAYRSSLIPWQEFKIAGRHAIADQRQRMTFEQKVDAAADDWRNQFQRVWHIQLLEDQNEQIEVDRQRSIPEEEGPTLQEIIATRCRLALGMVDEMVHGLLDTLLIACDPQLLGMFQLGQHVDGLVHPVPAFAELLTSDSDAFPRTAVSTAPDQPASWGEFLQAADESRLSSERDATQTRREIWNSCDRSHPRRLPRNPLPSSLPSNAWWTELASLAMASGMTSSDFGQIQDTAPLVDAHRVVIGVQNMIDSHFSETLTEPDPTLLPNHNNLGNPPNPTSEWEPTPAGIEFHEHRREIRIARGTEAIRVTSPTTFRVLRYMAQKGDSPTTKIELLDEWAAFNDNSPPESRSAVSNQIAKIRRLLHPLGFDVPNLDRGRDCAWRIVQRSE